MIKIAHLHEIIKLSLPKEIYGIIRQTVGALDQAYGVYRDVDGGDGGYVLVVETKEDLETLQERNLPLQKAIPEYVDTICCENGETYISTLVLLSSDFAVHLIIPHTDIFHDKLPDEIKEQIGVQYR